MTYKFPPKLELLDLYLRQRGVDVDGLKTERHALDVLSKTARAKVRFPMRGQSCTPAMCKIHERLFPYSPIPVVRRKSRVHGIGTVGPASRVRQVSDETRLEIERTANAG